MMESASDDGAFVFPYTTTTISYKRSRHQLLLLLRMLTVCCLVVATCLVAVPFPTCISSSSFSLSLLYSFFADARSTTSISVYRSSSPYPSTNSADPSQNNPVSLPTITIVDASSTPSHDLAFPPSALRFQALHNSPPPSTPPSTSKSPDVVSPPPSLPPPPTSFFPSYKSTEHSHRSRHLAPEEFRIGYIYDAIDTVWVILCGSLVFFMNAGFAFLESGSCRAKNATSVLVKNMMDIVMTTLVWWIWGYGLAFGKDSGSGFIGTNMFFTDEAAYNYNPAGSSDPFSTTSNPMKGWFFQWAFCAATVTICSGAIVERVRLEVYAGFVVVMTGWVYPLIVHWSWGGGWLNNVADTGIGFLDFAGSGVVHLTGGVCALVGAAVTGPRIGRYEPNKFASREEHRREFRPHNVPLMIMGMFVLWMAWYGFNCGSTFTLFDEAAYNVQAVALVAMNTTLSAAAGGGVAFLLRSFIETKRQGKPVKDVVGFSNGFLGGLVSVTGSCNNIHNWSALVIGMIGGAVFVLSSEALEALTIDDPLEASSVHGACGAWGVIAAGLFDKTTGAFFRASEPGVGGTQLAVQLAMLAVIVVWAGFFALLYFIPCKLLGVLRVSEEEELLGLDLVMYGGPAYSWMMAEEEWSSSVFYKRQKGAVDEKGKDVKGKSTAGEAANGRSFQDSLQGGGRWRIGSYGSGLEKEGKVEEAKEDTDEPLSE